MKPASKNKKGTNPGKSPLKRSDSELHLWSTHGVEDVFSNARLR
jgi:hypothetical protein